MRLILFILVFLSVGANAQMVIKAHANYVPFAPLIGDLLLDSFPNSAAAYSLRKLDKDYAGAAIRVRKDTTGQPESDIGFLSSGQLDTVNLKSFLNARSGFVVKWYSQGDSTSVDFEQSTQANQPRIALNGVIDRDNGKPCVVFDGSNDFLEALNSTSKFNYLHNGNSSLMSFVLNMGNSSNPNAVYQILSSKSIVVGRGFELQYRDRTASSENNQYACLIGNAAAQIVSNLQNDRITPNAQGLITIINDADNATAANRNIAYFNNANETKNNTLTGAISTGNAAANMNLGRRSDNLFQAVMKAQEIIFWSVDRSADRTTIQTNINTYYGIY
jgi:hypothetical protein